MKKQLLLILIIFSLLNSFSQEKYPLETVLQTGHSKHITCSAFSPDGKYIVTGGYDNAIILWNIKNGREIRTFNGHTAKIRSIAFSSDGTKILSSSADNKTIVFDVLTANALQTINVKTKELRKAVFSPDDSKILTMDNRDEIKVFDANTGNELGTYKKSFSASINSFWISPDGQNIVSYLNYKQAVVHNIKTSKELFKINFDKTNTISYSADGKYIAIGSAKLFAEVFDATTGELVNRYKDNEKVKCDGCNTLVAISNDSKKLLTGTTKTGLSLWDIQKGTKIKTFMQNKDRLRHIAFSPDDKYVLAKTDDVIFVFDVKSGKKLLEQSSDTYNYFEVCFSPNSKYIITPHKNNTAAIWDITSSKIVKVLGGYLNKDRSDGLKFKYTDWTAVNILKYISMKSSVAISPDGKYIVKGNIDSIAIMIDISTGKIVREFKAHSKTVFSFDFSSDGKTLVTSGGDKFIKLWNTETGEEIRTIYGHKDLVFDVKFSSDDKYLISGSWDGTLRIWETATGKEIQYIKLGNVSPYVVGFTPNDLYAVSSDLDKKLKLWEVDAGANFRDIIGHTDIVSSFDFTPNGKLMITGSWDGTVKVWDLLTGMLVKKFINNGGAVNSVACDPNGKYIVFGSSDRTIKFWDLETGKIFKTLTGNSNSITSVKITPDAKNLVSCSVDGVIKLWNLETYKEVYTYIQIDRNNWLAKNKAGYFDGSKDALKSVNYVSGLEVVSVGSLFEKYYTPGLIKRIMQGEKFSDTETDLNKILKESPQLNIQIIEANNKIVNIRTDSVYKWRNEILPITINVAKQGGELDEIRIYNNGKLVFNEKIGESPVFRGTAKFSKTYDIKLADGNNDIKTVVINKERTESLPANIIVNYDGEDAKTDLYILAIGINEYQNPKYNLKYAVNDAKSYVNAIKENSIDIFNDIEVVNIKNKDANKENILKQVSELAKKVGPEDVFLFYYAGHGVMSIEKENSEFYIVTYNVTNLYGDKKMLDEKAISSKEILEFSVDIVAEKQLFVLDACQSGGAIKAFATRGASREKAIAQLARSTGTFFLTASQDVQYANEAGNLKHGLFTYAILEALAGKADGGSADKKITVNEIKSYVEDRVPQLSEEYHGSAQYPTGYSFGQDFPIVIVK